MLMAHAATAPGSAEEERVRWKSLAATRGSHRHPGGEGRACPHYMVALVQQVTSMLLLKERGPKQIFNNSCTSRPLSKGVPDAFSAALPIPKDHNISCAIDMEHQIQIDIDSTLIECHAARCSKNISPPPPLFLTVFCERFENCRNRHGYAQVVKRQEKQE